MKSVLIIIPAYNEEKSILNVVSNIKKVKTNNYLIDLPSNLGIGGAVQTGYKYAYYKNYDIAIQIDGDNQHNPSYITNLCDEINNGYDLVIGSRFVENLSKFKSSFLRRVGINFLSNLIKICTGVKIYDVTSGFRACNKDIIEYFANNYPIDYPEPDSLVQVLKQNKKVKEIPVEMNERKTGKSSIRGLKSIYYMIKVSFAIIISNITAKKGNR